MYVLSSIVLFEIWCVVHLANSSIEKNGIQEVAQDVINLILAQVAINITYSNKKWMTIIHDILSSTTSKIWRMHPQVGGVTWRIHPLEKHEICDGVSKKTKLKVKNSRKFARMNVAEVLDGRPACPPALRVRGRVIRRPALSPHPTAVCGWPAGWVPTAVGICHSHSFHSDPAREPPDACALALHALCPVHTGWEKLLIPESGYNILL